MTQVLLLAPSPIKSLMAGPAIRFVEFARHLARLGHPVVLGSPTSVQEEPEEFRLVHYHHRNLKELVDRAGVVVIQGLVLQRHPYLKKAGKPLVVDLYDPVFLESLTLFAPDDPDGPPRHNYHLARLMETVEAGDFFMCASPRQRDLWLGFLAALNRINPATFGRDPELRRLIDIVPFGLEEKPPRQTGPGPRALPGVGPKDELILWNGGIWDWLAPEPLVEALALLAPDRPGLKLVFMGVKNPDSRLGESAALVRVRKLVRNLGLEERVVFNDWVPYEERADFLLEAAVGACLYPAGLETDYSFRTRLLDLIWAGRPILCSGGDDLGRLVAEKGLGLAAADHCPETVAQALTRLLGPEFQTPELARRAREAARDMGWSRAVEPLAAFCAHPAPAPDKAGTYPSRPQTRFSLSYYARRMRERIRNKTLLTALRDRWRYRGQL